MHCALSFVHEAFVDGDDGVYLAQWYPLGPVAASDAEGKRDCSLPLFSTPLTPAAFHP